MKLIIDIHERRIFKLIQGLQKTHKVSCDIFMETLPIGDFIIKDDKDKELLIIERKTLGDLAASITDGRYKEQSFRLHHLPQHNHNIIYLIEGNADNYNNRYSRIDVNALFSAMISLQYFKGFSVFRTFDMVETAEYLLRLVKKLGRETEKFPFYSNTIISTNSVTSPSNSQQSGGTQHLSGLQQPVYSSVIKRVKKNNITPENIGEIILSQIPGISTTISLAIMSKFGSLYKLMFALNDNGNCLENMTYVTKKGQERRISYKAIESIVTYLLYQKDNVITINTET